MRRSASSPDKLRTDWSNDAPSRMHLQGRQVMSLTQLVRSFLADEHGAASVEYAIVVAIIAGATVVIVSEYEITSVFAAVVAKVTTIISNI
jgi:Flp pilus assembly pilin Flp